MHSLKYIGQNYLEVIMNSPDKLLLVERRELDKEVDENPAKNYALRFAFFMLQYC